MDVEAGKEETTMGRSVTGLIAAPPEPPAGAVMSASLASRCLEVLEYTHKIALEYGLDDVRHVTLEDLRAYVLRGENPGDAKWRNKAAAATSALLAIDHAGRDARGMLKCKCRMYVNMQCASCTARMALDRVHREDGAELQKAVGEFHAEIEARAKAAPVIV